MSANFAAIDVLGRARAIAGYQREREPGRRPVLMMLAGALLATISAALCAFLAYDIWYERTVDASTGLFGVSLLFCIYVGGAYVFALAYELYDQPRAVRLTILLALAGVLALGFMIGALVALAFVKTGTGIAVSEQQGSKVLGALTYFGSEEEDGPPRAEPVPGFAMVTCKNCDRQFFPVPPTAICPWCDTPFLTI